MPQNQPPAPLSARLAERRGDIQYVLGVRLRDALRTVQSHAWQTTAYFWLGLFMALIGLLIGISAKGAHTGPGEHYGLLFLGALYALVALALFAMHVETRRRERKWRNQSHGGTSHPER